MFKPSFSTAWHPPGAPQISNSSWKLVQDKIQELEVRNCKPLVSMASMQNKFVCISGANTGALIFIFTEADETPASRTSALLCRLTSGRWEGPCSCDSQLKLQDFFLPGGTCHWAKEVPAASLPVHNNVSAPCMGLS